MAAVPGVSATTLALIESHTLTTVSRVGSWCSRSSSAALFSKLSLVLFSLVPSELMRSSLDGTRTGVPSAADHPDRRLRAGAVGRREPDAQPFLEVEVALGRSRDGDLDVGVVGLLEL